MFRLLLPVKRFSIPPSKTSSPIPTLTGRQFVVSKMDSTQEKTQRELFWYREALLERLKASWKEVRLISVSSPLVRTRKGMKNVLATDLSDIYEPRQASGTRHGELSLRRQRFTQHMLSALRTDGVRVRLSVAEFGKEGEDEGDGSDVKERSRTPPGRTRVQPNAPVSLAISVQNLTGTPHPPVHIQ